VIAWDFYARGSTPFHMTWDCKDYVVCHSELPRLRRVLVINSMGDESLAPSRLVSLLEDLSIDAVTALWLTSEYTAVTQGLNRFLTELRYVEPGLNGR